MTEWLTEWSPEWLSDRRGQLPPLKSGAATFVRSPALRTDVDVDQWLQDCVWWRRRLWESVRWRGANLTSTSAQFPLWTGFATGIRYSIRYACDTFNSLWSTIKIARLSAGVNIGSPARGVAQAPRRGRIKSFFPTYTAFRKYKLSISKWSCWYVWFKNLPPFLLTFVTVRVCYGSKISGNNMKIHGSIWVEHTSKNFYLHI